MENKIKKILETIKIKDTTTTDYTLCIHNKGLNLFRIIIIKGNYNEYNLASGRTIIEALNAALIKCETEEVVWSPVNIALTLPQA